MESKKEIQIAQNKSDDIKPKEYLEEE